MPKQSMRGWLILMLAWGGASGRLAAQVEPAAEAPLAIAPGDAGLRWGPCPPLFPKGCDLAVLHGDPARPNADLFLRVPPGYRIPSHWHTSAERMILVAGELRVEYDGHPAAVLEPGRYAYGPGRAPHRGVCVGKTSCILFIAFESPVDGHPGANP